MLLPGIPLVGNPFAAGCRSVCCIDIPGIVIDMPTGIVGFPSMPVQAQQGNASFKSNPSAMTNMAACRVRRRTMRGRIGSRTPARKNSRGDKRFKRSSSEFEVRRKAASRVYPGGPRLCGVLCDYACFDIRTVPHRKSHDYLPWPCVQMRLQYTVDAEFTRVSSSYAGKGRNASDNNVILGQVWFP